MPSNNIQYEGCDPSLYVCNVTLVEYNCHVNLETDRFGT